MARRKKITEENVWEGILEIYIDMVNQLWEFSQDELSMSLISITCEKELAELRRHVEFAETLDMHKGNMFYMMSLPLLESDKMHRGIRRVFKNAKTEEERRAAPAEWYKFIGIAYP